MFITDFKNYKLFIASIFVSKYLMLTAKTLPQFWQIICHGTIKKKCSFLGLQYASLFIFFFQQKPFFFWKNSKKQFLFKISGNFSKFLTFQTLYRDESQNRNIQVKCKCLTFNLALYSTTIPQFFYSFFVWQTRMVLPVLEQFLQTHFSWFIYTKNITVRNVQLDFLKLCQFHKK